jgi:hypothetical protein
MTGGASTVAVAGVGVGVGVEQLDKQCAVVPHRVPEVLRRCRALFTCAGNAVRGSVPLDELGMLDRDVRCPLLEVVHRVAAVSHHPVHEVIRL